MVRVCKNTYIAKYHKKSYSLIYKFELWQVPYEQTMKITTFIADNPMFLCNFVSCTFVQDEESSKQKKPSLAHITFITFIPICSILFNI